MHMCARTHTYPYIHMCVQKYLQIVHLPIYRTIKYPSIYICICVCVSNAHYIYKVYTRVRVYPFVCDQHTFSPDGKAHKIDNKLKARTGHIERGAQTVQSQEDISWRLQRRPLWFLVLSETMHGQFWILSIAFGCLAYIYIYYNYI